MRLRGDEEGSIALLSIGYAVLALMLVVVCVDATSLHLAQKRAEATAAAAALAAADGFTLTVDGGTPAAVLTDAGVREQAAAVLAVYPNAELIDAATVDGRSARVTVQVRWHPPVSNLLVPGGLILQATATSRTSLR